MIIKLSGKKEDGPTINWESPLETKPIRISFLLSTLSAIQETDKLEIVYINGAIEKKIPITAELRWNSSSRSDITGSVYENQKHDRNEHIEVIKNIGRKNTW